MKSLLKIALSIMIALLGACSKEARTFDPATSNNSSIDSGSGKEEAPTPLAIVINPAVPIVRNGEFIALQATGIYPYDGRIDLTSLVEWGTDSGTIAIFPAGQYGVGALEAVGEGETMITATYKDVVGSVPVVVLKPEIKKLVIDDLPAVIDIEVTDAGAIIPTQLNLSLTGVDTDHRISDQTEDGVWSTSDKPIAEFSETEPGALTVHKEGKFIVTAAVGTVTVDRTVTAKMKTAKLDKIFVSPKPVVIPLGATETLSIQGLYSNGALRDISTAVSIVAANNQVVSVTGNQVTATSVGSTELSVSLDGVTQKVDYQTGLANLVSMDITPKNVITPIGVSLYFTASGTYSDGEVYDITRSAVWTHSSPVIGNLSDSGQGKGAFLGAAVGTDLISASFLGATAQTSIQVSPAVLESISIVASAVAYPKGRSAILTAVGTYTDGVTGPITETVAWSSRSANIVVVSNTSGTRGNIQCVLKGNATIDATLDGISGSIDIAVLDPVVDAVVVQAQTGSMTTPMGKTKQLKAVGTMSDGSVSTVTSSAEWTLDTTSNGLGFAGLVSNTTGTKGRFTPIQMGTTGVIATINGHSNTGTFTVTEKEIEYVEIGATSSLMDIGTTQQLSATLTYTDGSTRNIADSTGDPDLTTTWTSPTNQDNNANGQVLTVNSTGLLTANMEMSGQVNVSVVSVKFAQTFTDFEFVGVRSVCVTSNPGNPTVVGKFLDNFFCVRYGAAGESCDTVCAGGGGTYNAATNYYFGSIAGTNGTGNSQACGTALGLFGLGILDSPNGTEPNGEGLGCTVKDLGVGGFLKARYTSPTTTSSASRSNASRICACTQ